MIGSLAQLDVLHMRHDYLLSYECRTIKHNSFIAPSVNKRITKHYKTTQETNRLHYAYYLFYF